MCKLLQLLVCLLALTANLIYNSAGGVVVKVHVPCGTTLNHNTLRGQFFAVATLQHIGLAGLKDIVIH